MAKGPGGARNGTTIVSKEPSEGAKLRKTPNDVPSSARLVQSLVRVRAHMLFRERPGGIILVSKLRLLVKANSPAYGPWLALLRCLLFFFAAPGMAATGSVFWGGCCCGCCCGLFSFLVFLHVPLTGIATAAAAAIYFQSGAGAPPPDPASAINAITVAHTP